VIGRVCWCTGLMLPTNGALRGSGHLRDKRDKWGCSADIDHRSGSRVIFALIVRKAWLSTLLTVGGLILIIALTAWLRSPPVTGKSVYTRGMSTSASPVRCWGDLPLLEAACCLFAQCQSAGRRPDVYTIRLLVAIRGIQGIYGAVSGAEGA